jgi:hypothetical protein
LSKTKPGYVQPDSRLTLAEAEQLIMTRAVRALQIRYQFGAEAWCDTLIPIPDGVRLVRIQQSE